MESWLHLILRCLFYSVIIHTSTEKYQEHVLTIVLGLGRVAFNYT